MADQPQPDRHRRALWTAAAVICLVLVAPWRVQDLDALARLAVGRHVVETMSVPSTDPFTYSRPAARWINPEWGGDILWYGAHEIGGGEPGMVTVSLLLAGLGILLTMAWTTRAGVSPPVICALVLVSLPALAGLLHARNYLHAYWLVPLYLLMLHRGRWLWVLGPLAILWANLHSSFVVGWVLVASAVADHLMNQGDGEGGLDWRARLRRPPVPLLLIILAAHPLLAMVGPHGAGVYGQLWDHLINADIYRQWVLEWRPPHETRDLLTQAPLHLLGMLGLISFLPRCNRRRVGGLLRLLACLALAYSSGRFLGLLAFIAAPDVAINIQRWLAGRDAAGLARRFAPAALLLAGLGLAGAAIHQVRTSQRPQVLERPGAPVSAATFLARRVPAGTRLFNTYNAGPYLLWLVPGIKLYIDPRNNLGAEHIKQYVERLLVDPAAFRAEAARTHTQLAMVDLTDGTYSNLAMHLRRSKSWKLIQMDGQIAIYRNVERALDRRLQREEYLVLEGTLDLEYLLQRHNVVVAHDLARAKKTAPRLAAVIEAYQLLRGPLYGPPPLVLPSRPRLTPRTLPLYKKALKQAQKDSARAATLLAGALPRLAPSAALMTYLATAHARAGNLQGCKEVLLALPKVYKDSPHVLGLKVELARLGGDARKVQALAAQMKALGHNRHVIWQILTSVGKR